MIKHIGEITTTGRRCAVVFTHLPEDLSNALIVDTEALPDADAQQFMELVNSREAQAAPQLAEVMARRILNTTGKTFLESFHHKGYLQKLPQRIINLTPTANQKFNLEEVVKAIIKPPTEIEKANFYQEQARIDADSDRVGTALGIIQQAELLEAEARALRNRAYAIAPSLQPEAQASIKAAKAAAQETKVDGGEITSIPVFEDTGIDSSGDSSGGGE